jgi:hypothetical protein
MGQDTRENALPTCSLDLEASTDLQERYEVTQVAL